MRFSPRTARWLAAGATLPLVGCGSANDQPPVATSLTPTELPGPALADPHAGGAAARLSVAEVTYGRLVDLYDRDPASGAEALQYTDLVVAPTLASDGADYALDQHAGRARLVVLHPAGSADFAAALERAVGGLPAVAAGPAPGALHPLRLAAVPRDAVLSVRFDDLLDAASIGAETVRVELGGAPLSVRVLPDPNHGGYADLDGDGGLEFYPTRAIVDPLVSRLDQLRGGGGTGSGWPAGSGWPESTRPDEANLLLLLAARASAGPPGAPALASAGGEALSAGPDGGDRALAFRAGGPTLLTGDPDDGLLAGGGAPRVLGEQPVDVVDVQALGRGRFLVAYAFDLAACRTRPAPGDVLEFSGALGEVLSSDQAFDPSTGVVSNVRLHLLAGAAAAVATGPALYVAPFDAAADVPECFVTISPAPSAPPVQGVSADAAISVRFDRPMDPRSFEALQTFTLERGWVAPPLEQLVVGTVQAGPHLERFRFVPSVPLATVAPVSPAAYVFDLDGSSSGVLAADGTPLAEDLPAVTFTLDPNQPQQSSSGIALVFDQLDEDGDGWPELRGQFLLELAAERIRARPVARFSAAVDATQPIVAVMVPLPGGVQTPLSGLGSKLMSVWRYCDMGFSLLDEAFHNIDVEGLYWSPSGGQVEFDQFEQFQLSLGHAAYLPDEQVENTLLPQFPNSGLSNTYDQNWLSGTQGAVVHPKAAGYTIDPLDQTSTAAGTPLMPWPLNRGIPSSQYAYWTWRDTAVQELGAPNGVGADPARLFSILGGASTYQGLYPEDQVPTIGLPLLTEFRAYPDAGAAGSNLLRVALAINSSANPYFRTYSTGGLLSGGQVLLVNPDLETVGTGGFNPQTGQKTAPRDNSVYVGQADFVVRVSRAHTVWFDTGGVPSFGQAVVEPAAAFQPRGTQVALAFRGATGIAAQVAGIWGTTKWIDPYGDAYDANQIGKLGGPPNETFSVSFLNGDATWKSSLSDLDGARYVQARITLISNAATGATPSVSGLGLPFVN